MSGVYLIHAEDGTHYQGYYKGKLADRIQKHQNTICYPPTPEEIRAAAEMGRHASWKHEGDGAHYLGVLNFKGIKWAVVRTWAGATRKWERQLKNCKKPSRFCPACRGERAFNCMQGKKAKKANDDEQDQNSLYG